MIWRFRDDVPDDVAREVARLAAREKGIPIENDVSRVGTSPLRGHPPTPPDRLAPIERRLAAASEEPLEIQCEWVVAEGRRIGELWRIS